MALMPGGAALAAPSPSGCGNRTNNTYDKVLEWCGSKASASIRRRCSGSPTRTPESVLRLRRYDASVDYSSTRSRSPATPRRAEVRLPRLRGRRPLGAPAERAERPTYPEGVDFGAITQSDPGNVTAAVTPVDAVGGGQHQTSGCQAADSTAPRAGTSPCSNAASCTFEIKAENAAAAGAVGIVIFNQGNTTAPDRNGIPASRSPPTTRVASR